MRTLKKSLLVLAGLLAPSMAHTPADAGVIPWVYDSIFGYGWGYGGMGYGGMPYAGWGYGGGYPVTYAAPAYSANYGAYTTNYGPSYGYSDYSFGGEYLADNSCCDPCATGGCSTGGCGTSDCCTAVQSAKPEVPGKNPTPVDDKEVTPTVPKDEFGPTNGGIGAGRSGTRDRGLHNTNVPGAVEESLPSRELRPGARPNDLEVPVDPPVDEMQEPDPELERGKLNMIPRNGHIAVRYVPAITRGPIAVPTSVTRVVRVDRAVREQLVKGQSKSQLASNP